MKATYKGVVRFPGSSGTDLRRLQHRHRSAEGKPCTRRDSPQPPQPGLARLRLCSTSVEALDSPHTAERRAGGHKGHVCQGDQGRRSAASVTCNRPCRLPPNRQTRCRPRHLQHRHNSAEDKPCPRRGSPQSPPLWFHTPPPLQHSVRALGARTSLRGMLAGIRAPAPERSKS